jgi:hypothetical protein
MSNRTNTPSEDRLDAWYDGSSVCVVAVSSYGVPLDLADHEVGDFIHKLKDCLAQSTGLSTKRSALGSPQPQVDRAPLAESWATTLRHLAACRFYLPECFATEEAKAAELELALYLHHNELGLALELAESLGDALDPPQQFWRELQLAAKSMGMHEVATRFSARCHL